MNSAQKQNRLRNAMQRISANVTKIYNRVLLAKAVAKMKLGIPGDGVHYRQVCPKGAGHRNAQQIAKRPQHMVGATKARRRSIHWIKQFSQTEWGRCLAGQ